MSENTKTNWHPIYTEEDFPKTPGQYLVAITTKFNNTGRFNIYIDAGYLVEVKNGTSGEIEKVWKTSGNYDMGQNYVRVSHWAELEPLSTSLLFIDARIAEEMLNVSANYIRNRIQSDFGYDSGLNEFKIEALAWIVKNDEDLKARLQNFNSSVAFYLEIQHKILELSERDIIFY